MKEEKQATYSRQGYRLQLLKITDTKENSYYQIRENRHIIVTYTTIVPAWKKFNNMIYENNMQKTINFGEPESIHTPKTEVLNLNKNY